VERRNPLVSRNPLKGFDRPNPFGTWSRIARARRGTHERFMGSRRWETWRRCDRRAAERREMTTTRPRGVVWEVECGLDAFDHLRATFTVERLRPCAAKPRRTLATLRSASACFQYQVALLLQTGTTEDRGLNPLAIGYIGLVTAPLFPGSEIAASSSAELCAIDVRSCVMLGCSRSRAEEMVDRFVFLWQLDRARERLIERTSRASVSAAAKDLLSHVSGRLASR